MLIQLYPMLGVFQRKINPGEFVYQSKALLLKAVVEENLNKVIKDELENVQI